MQRHATDEGVFIRSLRPGEALGGLSRATQDVVHVMDAMGRISSLLRPLAWPRRDRYCSYCPHLHGRDGSRDGDDIQAIKAGIIEIGDLFVINKCEREGADKMERDLRTFLEMNKKREDGWEPLIYRQRRLLEGIVELVSRHLSHKQALEQSNAFKKNLGIEQRPSSVRF